MDEQMSRMSTVVFLGIAVGFLVHFLAVRLPGGTASSLHPVVLGNYAATKHGSFVGSLWIEAVAASLFGAMYMRYGWGPGFAVLAMVSAILLLLIWIDLQQQRVRDRLLVVALVLAIVLAPIWPTLGVPRVLFGSDTSLASLGNSLLAGTTGYLFLRLLSLFSGSTIRKRDVHLVGILGLLLGVPGAFVALWVGIICAAFIVFLRSMVMKNAEKKQPVPFGLLVTFGALFFLIGGHDLVRLLMT